MFVKTNTFATLFLLVVLVINKAADAGSGQQERALDVGGRIIHERMPHPAWNGQYVHCFRSSEVTSTAPVVLFCHGIGAVDPRMYEALIHHIVSRGYVLVYSPFGSTTAMVKPMIAYGALWRGFRGSADEWGHHMDLSRIGVVGHSYGGGSVPWIARQALDAGWGKQGLMLYAMAPWYMHGMTRRDDRKFPHNTKLMVQVFEHDRINDHRMAKDMYSSIVTGRGEKAFVVLHSDWQEHTLLIADHDVPTGSNGVPGSVNALDTLGVYYIFDALANQAFQGTSERNVSNAFRFLGSADGSSVPNVSRRCLLARERFPRMKRSQEFCLNFWHHAMNPRTRVYKHVYEPVRLVLHTPVTVWNYCLLVPQYLQRQ